VHLTRLRRGARRACGAGAAACVVLAVVSPPVDAQGAEAATPRPQVFGGSATAMAASVQLDREGLLPVADIFRFIVADGSGTYRTSEQRARASLLFPGNGLVLGPGLACSQFPPEARPVFGPIIDACLEYSFPLSVTADSLAPDAATEGAVDLGTPADPLSARGVGARAHAGPDAVTTAAEVSDVHVLGTPALGPMPAVPGFEGLEPFLLAIGSAMATTDQRIDEAGALVVDSLAAVTDIALLGGLVRIDSLVSHARIIEGEGDPVTEASLEFSGVTVAGTPARITDRGLEVASASQPLGPALEALSAQLAALLESVSFRMEALGVEHGVDEDGIAEASVGGLLIQMRVPVSGLPAVPGPLGDVDLNGEYVGTVVLGEVGVRAVANSFDRVAPSVIGRSPAGGATGATGVAAGATGAGVGTPAAGSGPAAASPESPTAGVAQPVLDLFADRLRLLYLAFTLAGLALCLAPRLALPPRLPRTTT
jgi:hypothetical protein